MSSRQEQKKKLREEREAKERQEQEAKAKRARLMRIGVGAAVVVVAAVVAVVALSGGGSSKSKANGGSTDSTGMQLTPGPWNNGTDGLEARATNLALPDPSDTVFHVHANLTVYTDGKKQTVPQDIGIDSQNQFLASLHTHDDTGVVHMEAVQPYPFKLGQFFTIWGVPFTASQLGSYHTGPGLVLQTWVNGQQVKDGVSYVMKPHDKIVVGFGKPGSFPTKSKFQFPAGE